MTPELAVDVLSGIAGALLGIVVCIGVNRLFRVMFPWPR